jgi:hypothetical protein
MRLVFISSVIATTELRITSAVKASTTPLLLFCFSGNALPIGFTRFYYECHTEAAGRRVSTETLREDYLERS